MKFYLDTADASAVKALLNTYPIRGVTTNPAILSRIDKPLQVVVDELLEATSGVLPVFFQVVGNDAETMLREAEWLRKRIGESLILKIPASVEGYKVMRSVQGMDTPFTATAIHSPLQALLAAEYGARFVAPYVSRVDSVQADGAELVSQMVSELKLGGYTTEVIAASFRTPHQINQMALAGAHAVTIAPEMFGSISNHPLTDSSVAMFSDCWSARYQGATSLLDVIE